MVYASTIGNVNPDGLLDGSVATLSLPTPSKLITYGFSSISFETISMEAKIEPFPIGEILTVKVSDPNPGIEDPE